MLSALQCDVERRHIAGAIIAESCDSPEEDPYLIYDYNLHDNEQASDTNEDPVDDSSATTQLVKT